MYEKHGASPDFELTRRHWLDLKPFVFLLQALQFKLLHFYVRPSVRSLIIKDAILTQGLNGTNGDTMVLQSDLKAIWKIATIPEDFRPWLNPCIIR